METLYETIQKTVSGEKRKLAASKAYFNTIDDSIKKLENNMSEDCECVFCDEAFHEWLNEFDLFIEGEDLATDVPIDEEYFTEDGVEIDEAVKTGSVFGILLNPGLWVAWRLLGAATSKYKRKCGVISISKKRDSCIYNGKIIVAEKKIKIIGKGAQEAAKKNPDNAAEIKKKASKAIGGLREKIGKLKDKLKMLDTADDEVGKDRASKRF